MDTLSQIKEAAHHLIAPLGILAASGGYIVTFLAGLGVHGIDARVSGFVGSAGILAAWLSMATDSTNNSKKAASANSGPVAGVTGANVPPAPPAQGI